MSDVPGPEEIARDARWLAQAMDPATAQVRLVEMDRQAYRAASFLDDRMLRSAPVTAVLPWAQVAAALPGDARRDARWIFHIGHVGSTLIARLLGELEGVLAVREPRLLRDLAGVPAQQRAPMLGVVQSLFSRAFAADETALVKASSFVSEIATELVPQGERGLFLHAAPANYIASILAGANSVQELHALAPVRAGRMAARVPDLPRARNDAELAAMAWACEMTALEAAAEALPGRRIEWADFDQLLSDMPAALSRLATLFGFRGGEQQLRSIARGPLMSRYSKALEYDYSPRLRHDLIAEAGDANAREIASALALLRRAAETSPLLARALNRASED